MRDQAEYFRQSITGAALTALLAACAGDDRTSGGESGPSVTDVASTDPGGAEGATASTTDGSTGTGTSVTEGATAPTTVGSTGTGASEGTSADATGDESWSTTTTSGDTTVTGTTDGPDALCDPITTTGQRGTLGSAACWACVEQSCSAESFYCGCLADLALDGCRAAAEHLAKVDCKVVDEFVCLLANGGPFGGTVATDGVALLECASMQCPTECGGGMG